MTAIVGLECDGGVVMGGDSAASDEAELVQELRHPKVFRVKQFLVGFAGDFTVTNLLRYEFSPTRPGKNTDRAVCHTFCRNLQDFLKEKELKLDGTELLVALRGSLYVVHEDYSATAYREGYTAIGSGAATALGALHTCAADARLSAEQKVLSALSAAATHTTSVRPPFTILSTCKGPTWQENSRRDLLSS